MIIIGLLIALPILYFWLIGNWFARVLAFLGLFAFFAIFVLIANDAPSAEHNFLLGYLVAGGAAWIVSSLPTYYWRHRSRQFTAAVAKGSWSDT